jgi:hypothetical protein
MAHIQKRPTSAQVNKALGVLRQALNDVLLRAKANGSPAVIAQLQLATDGDEVAITLHSLRCQLRRFDRFGEAIAALPVDLVDLMSDNEEPALIPPSDWIAGTARVRPRSLSMRPTAEIYAHGQVLCRIAAPAPGNEMVTDAYADLVLEGARMAYDATKPN